MVPKKIRKSSVVAKKDLHAIINHVATSTPKFNIAIKELTRIIIGAYERHNLQSWTAEKKNTFSHKQLRDEILKHQVEINSITSDLTQLLLWEIERI
jgi:hypothetical protein